VILSTCERFNLNRLSYFIAVMEEGTITAAARRLGVSKAVVSRQLFLLEDELGTALLTRNTRHLHPTETGQRFYEQGKAAFLQACEAFRSAREEGDVLRGTLRVTAQLDYGTLHIAPRVARFISEYPEVRVDLSLDDELVDIIGQRFDIGFRVGWLADSSNRARKIGEFEEWVVGSPALGVLNIRRPAELQKLPFAANAMMKNITEWHFHQGADTRKITLRPALTLNPVSAMIRALEAGECFAILPDFVAEESLANGTLVRLLPEWTLRCGGIYAVTPPIKYRPLIVSRFLEYVTDHRPLS